MITIYVLLVLAVTVVCVIAGSLYDLHTEKDRTS